VICIAWGAAGAGWLLAQTAPLAVRAALEAGAITRAAQLRAARSKLAEAWGLSQAKDGP